jgi:hypothetical protein
VERARDPRSDLELTSWDRTAVQVCPACGQAICGDGSYPCARRADDHLLFVPAFHLMEKAEPSWETWAPPDFTVSEGSPVLDEAAIPALAGIVPCSGTTSKLQRLTLKEVIGMMQSKAPAGVRGSW